MLLRLTHVTEHHQPPEMADPQPTSTTPGKLLMRSLATCTLVMIPSFTELDQLSDNPVCVCVLFCSCGTSVVLSSGY